MVEKANKEKAGIRVKDPQKYEYAYLLYMQKVPQKEIAERVGYHNYSNFYKAFKKITGVSPSTYRKN